MPEFPKPNPDLTQEQALTMILSSIALEEVALSHIINAESEKIQYVLKKTDDDGRPAGLEDIIAVNRSVANLLEVVLQNQMILKNKMEKVLGHLPKPPLPPDPPQPPCPPTPPCPPQPPCPPKPPCPPPSPPCMPTACDLAVPPLCLKLMPGTYACNEPLLWQPSDACGRCEFSAQGYANIQLPYGAALVVDLCVDTAHCMYSRSEVELVIYCEDKCWMTQSIQLTDCGCESLLHKRTVIQMPCACVSCYARIYLRAPCNMHMRQGQVMVRRL